MLLCQSITAFLTGTDGDDGDCRWVFDGAGCPRIRNHMYPLLGMDPAPNKLSITQEASEQPGGAVAPLQAILELVPMIPVTPRVAQVVGGRVI